jgi:hypothetical protein
LSDNLHQRAKEVFGKLVDLPREVQAKELEKFCAGDPQLRHEVGSLLDFHTARSLMAEPPKPKIRNRSTLSTTRLRKSWLQRALAYLPILALIILLTAAILPLTMYISAQVESKNEFLVEQKLNSVISARASQLDAWYSDKRTALLATASKASVLEQLQNTQVDANEIQRSIEEALAGSATFCLWDKQMHLLSRTQVATDVKEIPGWTPFRCADLMSAAGGKLIVRIPVPGQCTLPPPLNNVDATAFCPVKSPAGEVVATLVIQSPVIGKSFDELVAKWNEKAEAR